MKNKHAITIPLPSDLALLGDGISSQDTLCDMLAKAQGFEDFDHTELMCLAKHMKAYRVSAGSTIFRERDRNSYLGVVVEGRICVYKEDCDNENKLFGFVTAGRIFGEISVIDYLPYSASLLAESDAIILLMSRENFNQCINENPLIGVRLLKLIARLLCTRLRSTSGQLVDYIDV